MVKKEIHYNYERIRAFYGARFLRGKLIFYDIIEKLREKYKGFMILIDLLRSLKIRYYSFSNNNIYKNHKSGNKIFGIGLSKTGTTSLTRALRLLGYKTIHQPPFNKIYKKLEIFDAATDTAVAYRFKELDKIFPNSKFILTIRDTESWLKSCKYHFYSYSRPSEYLPYMNNYIMQKIYDTSKWDKKKFFKAYRKHLNEVKSYFKNRPNDLLIINIINGEGWNEICSFLGKKIPKIEFPDINKTFQSN